MKTTDLLPLAIINNTNSLPGLVRRFFEEYGANKDIEFKSGEYILAYEQHTFLVLEPETDAVIAEYNPTHEKAQFELSEIRAQEKHCENLRNIGIGVFGW